MCPGELWKFFGLHLLMGLLWKPTIKDYWATDPLMRTPIFNEMMSRNRFEEILLGMHFVDNEDIRVPKTDRFWILGKILKSILSKFRNIVMPGEF